MTDERLDATAAALRGAADAVRGVREARAQLTAELADATRRAEVAEEEIQATRDRARRLIADAEAGADRGDAVPLNIAAAARYVVGATAQHPPAIGLGAPPVADTDADLAALLDVAREIVDLNDTGYYRMIRLRAALDHFPTSDDAAGCVVSPEDPQSPTTTRGPDMGG